MKQTGRFILITVTILIVLFVVLRNYCPTSGLTPTKHRREFHQLKNRTAVPRQTDFESLVTLEALLQPGEDQARWSTSRAAQIEGYVVSVSAGPLEAANCYCRRDIHIMLARRPSAPPREQVVLEITPVVRAVHPDWSQETLTRDLTGHWVRFEGWLLFDSAHAAESENTAAGRTNNWRATAWELHPITKIEVLK
jgi:hypothetical protein